MITSTMTVLDEATGAYLLARQSGKSALQALRRALHEAHAEAVVFYGSALIASFAAARSEGVTAFIRRALGGE